MTAASLQRHINTSEGMTNLNKGTNTPERSSPPPLAATGSPGSSSSPDPSPEPIISSAPAVPNPFALPSSAPQPPPTVGSIDWTQAQTQTQTHQGKTSDAVPTPTPSAPINVPNPFQATRLTNGAAIASSGMRLPVAPPGYVVNTPSKAAMPPSMIPEHLSQRTQATQSLGCHPAGHESTSRGGGLNHRRQKRLERNRESARLSRRRRKQYLEVLEERVTTLSEEMDRGRREHVARAINTLQEKRRKALTDESHSKLLIGETALCRTSDELRVAATFQSQQLLSLSFPPQMKFLLWLSLQNDVFFRGGRAASERLSAARIGERMLSSGNNKVSPAHGMWPLFCNEVGLSYDQEEKVRLFQRTLLMNHESWLSRHTASSSGLVISSFHDCLQSVAMTVRSRSRLAVSGLGESRRIALTRWCENNRDRVRSWHCGKVTASSDSHMVSSDQHVAANLYILNHRLRNVMMKLNSPPVLVTGPALKRLSRRPSFESLGSSGNQEKTGKDESNSLSRESTFASSGSLKRSASELSEMDEERTHGHNGITPQEAQTAAQVTIRSVLGHLKHIIPQPPKVAAPYVESATTYKVCTSQPSQLQQPLTSNLSPGTVIQPSLTRILPLNDVSATPHQIISAPIPASQQQTASFLPPTSLNAVPEEGFLQGQGAEDFLFDLAEDWAIGEGFEMDTT